MSENVQLVIDGKKVSVPSGTSILEACRAVGSHIPTLCDHPEIEARGKCRICIVEELGTWKLKSSCNTKVDEVRGEILTSSPKVRMARKNILELILANHPLDCLSCIRNTKCELQQLANDEFVDNTRFENVNVRVPIKADNPSLVRDNTKCIKCGRCVQACNEIQSCYAIGTSGRSIHYDIGQAFNKATDDSTCVLCGKCITVCPVGALHEVDDTDRVWAAIDHPQKYVVFQTAPSVRVGIGDDFGFAPGEIATGQLVAGIRRLGVNKVIDTNFAADLTIMEEGTELLGRLQEGGSLPMITSCSPGWINFVEKNYPDLLDHLSTCKSPQQMFGAVTKTYYAEKIGVDPEDMFVVSVMPCVAKKYERGRDDMDSSGENHDIDVVLTTRELSRMFKQAGLDLHSLDSSDYDQIIGYGSGAGTIFGTSGGVMEAALRTVYETITGEEPESLDFEAIRGHKGVKTASVDIDGMEVKVAITNGLGNAREILEEIQAGNSPYHFIEVMACPGGCVGGGGQPFSTNPNLRRERMKGLYKDDKKQVIRKSHENPEIKQIYEEFLGEPNSHKAHELLHTSYTPRKTRA